MSALTLLFNRDSSKIQKNIFENIFFSLKQHSVNGSDIAYKGNIALGIHYFHTTPEQVNEKQPLKIDENLFILFDGRLDNRSELLRELNFPDNKTISDTKIVGLIYKKHRKESFELLLGSFCFVIIDTKKNKVIAVRDQLGNKNLCYYIDNKKLIISTEEHAILNHPQITKDIEEERLVEYFTSCQRFSNKTFFKNIYELYPATYIEVDENSFNTHTFWDLSEEKKLRYKNLEDYYEHFREIFEESINCRLRTIYDPSILLSGGIDSTAVTSVAHKILSEKGSNSRLKTYSYFSRAEDAANDLNHINLVNEHFDLENKIFDTDKYLPFENLSLNDFSLNHPHLSIFNNQIKTVYSSLFSDNRRTVLNGGTADQILMSGNRWLRDLFLDYKFDRALSEIHKNIRKYGIIWLYRNTAFRLLFSYLKPLRNLYNNPNTISNLYYWSSDYGLSLIKDKKFWVHKYSKHHRIDQVLYALGLAKSHDSSNYALNISGGPIDFRRPFRDRRLVSFLLNIPAYLIYSFEESNKNKQIIKESLKDILPKETYSRTDCGIYTQLIIDGYYRNEDKIFKYLDSKDNYKKYIDLEWLEKMRESNKKNDWYMVVIWQCYCYEKWLEKIGLS